MKKNKKIDILLKENNLGIKLDIGGGGNPQPGFVNMDIRKLPGVDIIQDLEEFPWSLPNESVSLSMASHVVEHINPHKNTFMKFMDEVWRITQIGGKFMIATPYAGSPGYFQDPTHVNPCNEITFAYFAPLDISKLYYIYEPAPWKIIDSTWNNSGNLEVVLEKIRDDISYHSDKKIKYK